MSKLVSRPDDRSKKFIVVGDLLMLKGRFMVLLIQVLWTYKGKRGLTMARQKVNLRRGIWLCGFVIPFVGAQNTGPDAGDSVANFQPSLAVVIGILSVMFSLTFLLLVYAKFCHSHRGASSVLWINHQHGIGSPLGRSASGLSGIDKKVIESLPFFKFSSLRGSRWGLECAVCLSRFEDIEVLRLLPKCKHAFHVGCIDLWLEKHSSCPICRCRVSADDVTTFAGSESLRFLSRNSEIHQDSNIELFVQREQDRNGSSRFSIGSSFRSSRIEKGIGNEDQEILIQDQEGGDDDRRVQFHKLNHEIVVYKNRWSNVSSSDLMLLNSEMLNDTSSKRFSELGSSTNDEQISKITKIGSSTSNTVLPMTASEKRSISDITCVSRFGDGRVKNRIAGESCLIDGSSVREARMRRLWLPIARKTVEWLADREKRSKISTQPEAALDV